jgi:hypothetical protein
VAGTWTVPATVVMVMDSTTLLLDLSLGWNIWVQRKCRLIGCVAPDPSTDEGLAAIRRLMDLLDRVIGEPLVFVSLEYDRDSGAVGQLLGSTAQGTMIDISAEMMPQ